MARVLVVTTSYPGRHGEATAGVFVPEFAQAMVAAGVDVDLVAPASVDGEGKEDGIWVRRFAVPRLPLSLLSPVDMRDWGAIVRTLRCGLNSVGEVAERRRPDHILALWVLPSGDWAMRVGRRLGIPYSTWALGSDIWSLGRLPVIRQHLGRVLRQANGRFADGYRLAEDVARIGGRPCDFLPTSRGFGPVGGRIPNREPPYRLAFLGRWHPNKGVDLLIDALDLLDEKDWAGIEAVRLHGGGPLAGLVQEGVERLARHGRPVSVGGYLDLQEARGLFEWADCVLIPSRIESIPVVFSDAMQAQRPVIATPVGDLPRLIIEGRNGWLSADANSRSLAETLKTLVSRGHRWNITTEDTEFFSPGAAARRFLDSLSPA